MIMTNSALTNQCIIESQLIMLQLSYSTADIEKSIFNKPEDTPLEFSEPIGKAAIIVVHGEMFVLEERAIPEPSIPLTKKSALFQIVDLGK